MSLLVTDHALVRYIERVMGLDVETVRNHIGAVCSGVRTARTVKAEGVQFVIAHGRVVTVKPMTVNNPRRVPR